MTVVACRDATKPVGFKCAHQAAREDRMITICVTSHNSNDPDCRRISLARWYRFDPESISEHGTDERMILEEFVHISIRENEGLLKLSFPRGMTYNVPYSEVEIVDADVHVFVPQDKVPVILGLKEALAK